MTALVTPLAPIMQGFFTERLAQRRAGEHTIAAYRDTFRLLLAFAQQQHRCQSPESVETSSMRFGWNLEPLR